MRVAQGLAYLLGSTLIAAPVGQTGVATPTRTFSLYLLGHQIGQETRTETATEAGRRLAFDFKYIDRGTEVALASTLELAPDGSPRHLAIKGKTYRYFNADSEVTITGTRVRVRDGNRTSEFDTRGKPFFPLDTFAPVGVHEELLKYWLAQGRPAEILTAPAGPLRIRSHGVRVMAVGEGDYQFKIERLSIDGAVWGTETAFITAGGPPMANEVTGRTAPPAGDIYGLFTWAGGLGFEAIAYTNEGHYDRLAGLSVADRIDDLLRLDREIAPVRTGSYALVGGTVIDGTDRPPVRDATVVIRDGRIAAVGPKATTAVPRGVQTVDARGQFVIPGLWDMHAHVSQIDWFPAYLASGVTTIRDMGGEFGFLSAAKAAIGGAGALGPRLLAAGLIDGPGPRAFGKISVSTPSEARAAVREYAGAGFEQIKVYLTVPPALVPVITAEAHRLGMNVTGHVPAGMTAQSVVEAGFDSLAHMQLRGQPTSSEAAASIAFFKRHGTVMDPTLSWNEFLSRPASTPLSAIHPDIDRLPPALGRLLAATQLSNTDPAALGSRQLAAAQLLRDAVRAGVPVVAGTDKGIPGFSLQRELELYVAGGMTPLEALQAATIVPARAMGLDPELGSIEAGKRADLVVLSADPLAAIGAVRSARRVIVNGRLYDTAPLWKAAGFLPRK